jgi:type IV pilus assembly protein PilZ
MRRLDVELARPEDFRDIYLPDVPGGGLFVETTEEFSVGEQIVVCVVFPEIPRGVPLQGEVIWRRRPARWRSALKPGIGVAFARLERARLDFLEDFSAGMLAATRKKGRRVPASLACDFVVGGRRYSSVTRDIGREGVFILTKLAVASGTPIEMDVVLDESRPAERLRGHVVWCRQGEADAGIGVKFEFRGPARQLKVEQLVTNIENRLSRTEAVELSETDAHIVSKSDT